MTENDLASVVVLSSFGLWAIGCLGTMAGLSWGHPRIADGFLWVCGVGTAGIILSLLIALTEVLTGWRIMR